MAVEQNIPTPWIGAEELPVHFANAFGISVGPHAVFLLIGSMIPANGEGGAPPPFIPVTPVARLAIAPAALPQLIKALQGAQKTHQKTQAQDR